MVLLLYIIRSLTAEICSIFFFGTSFPQGFGMGTCDTGGNLLIIYLYGADVGPYMQLLQ